MLSQKQKLLQKAGKNFCRLKLFLREMSYLLVLIWTHGQLIYKMIYRFHLKLSNLKKTSNYDYRDNIPNENNCEHIKNSKYPNCRETSAKVYSFSKNSFLKI